ncbi:hypothetical protein [Spiroplasma endosymbiont of Nomada rufipes]|uniref:hypothetical protein n=1 Tax=Spiroplasma endosymbiont of Nomada rufipes TaxID=3077933 RepID=UPI00376F31A1
MRLIVFCTGKKKNGKLINKRAACQIRVSKTEIGAEKTAKLIEKCWIILALTSIIQHFKRKRNLILRIFIFLIVLRNYSFKVLSL